MPTVKPRHLLLAFLDRMRCGGLLVDPAGDIVDLNDTAREILEKTTAVDIGVQGTGGAQRGLERLLGGEIRQFLAAGSVLATDAGARWPIVVSAIPIGSADKTSTIILLDLNRPSPPDVQALQTIFQLTAAEANLAVQIARGLTLTEISQAQGVSMNTVRGHLAATFAKTQTRRQAELTALMVRLSLI